MRGLVVYCSLFFIQLLSPCANASIANGYALIGYRHDTFNVASSQFIGADSGRYINDGNGVDTLAYYYDFNGGNWNYNHRYNYHITGNSTDVKSYDTWDSATASWVYQKRSLENFNTSGNVLNYINTTYSINQIWDPINQQWKNVGAVNDIDQVDIGGNTDYNTETLTYQAWDSNDNKFGDSIHYTYSSTNNFDDHTVQVLVEKNVGGHWVKIKSYYEEYYPYPNPLAIWIDTTNGNGGNSIFYLEKWSFKYDNQTQYQTIVDTIYDSTLMVLRPKGKTVSYNPNGYILTSEYFTWSVVDSSYKKDSLLTFAYDSFYDLTYKLRQNYDTLTSAYVNVEQFFYYYYPDNLNGVMEAKEASTLSVYPNPTSNGLGVTVSVNADKPSKYDLNIYDIDGRLVQSEVKSIFTGANTFSIETKGWHKGIYIIQLKNQVDGTTSAQRFTVD